jgi:hypothetical protein
MIPTPTQMIADKYEFENYDDALEFSGSVAMGAPVDFDENGYAIYVEKKGVLWHVSDPEQITEEKSPWRVYLVWMPK